MNNLLNAKLHLLPASPGVYFHKDKNGEIIYVGKAAVLKNRVRQYFQSQRAMDNKTQALVSEIVDTDWVETDSEIDALFLEAEMVKRYMPRYNILLRDDKSLTYVRIDMKSELPFVSFTRNPADDGAEYFGPFHNGFAVKKALRYLRKIFPYYTKSPKTKKRLDLEDHLGLTPAKLTNDEYKKNLRKLISYINGNRKKLINDLESDMKQAAKVHEFELASVIRNQIQSLRELQQRIMFGDKEFLDISKDQALGDLTDMLLLKKVPVRIEGYDISHVSGSNVVGSMVVFKNGVSDRGSYRKFKMHVSKNDDFANMFEAIRRRFGQKNIDSWGKPDLILIDGGKGQLDAALRALFAVKQSVGAIGLAKRDEQIVIKNDMQINDKKVVELGGYIEKSNDFSLINLPNSAHIIKLLQRIRDESHRFAVSYHTSLNRAGQSKSAIDSIPGIGPKTRAKLIRKFGSINGIKNASDNQLAGVVGPQKAKTIRDGLRV